MRVDTSIATWWHTASIPPAECCHGNRKSGWKQHLLTTQQQSDDPTGRNGCVSESAVCWSTQQSFAASFDEAKKLQNKWQESIDKYAFRFLGIFPRKSQKKNQVRNTSIKPADSSRHWNDENVITYALTINRQIVLFKTLLYQEMMALKTRKNRRIITTWITNSERGCASILLVDELNKKKSWKMVTWKLQPELHDLL